MANPGVWIGVIKATDLYLLCLFLHSVNLSLAACGKECYPDIPRIQASMRPGRNLTLCLDYQYYSLRNVSLLGTNCDGLDNYVRPSVNATYRCTVLNITQRTIIQDGNLTRICEQLVIIECLHAVPTMGVSRSESVGSGGADEDKNSDDASDDSDGGSDKDDATSSSDEDDLVLGLLMESSNPTMTEKKLCNVFVNVSMMDPGLGM